MSSLSVISSMNYTLDVVSEKSSPHWRSSTFSPVIFEFFSFVFSFRSMNQFGLIFLMAVGSVSIFCFCMWMSSCSSTVYGKNYNFFTVSPLLVCQTSVDYLYMGLFLGSILCVLIYFSILSPVSHCLDYYNRTFLNKRKKIKL